MKALIRLCFERPVSVAAFYLFIGVLAVVAYIRLPVALLPDLRFPALMIWTAYPDVPPERVERTVTERIEEAVAGTNGVRRLTSRSQLGGSLVRLDFGWNTNLDLALLDVREQIARLGNSLPERTESPAVLRLDPSERPMMLLALSEARDAGNRQDLVTLKQVGREVIARRLEQLDDVARVEVTGGHERQIDIRLDPNQLSAYQLSIERIEWALAGANTALSGGVIRRGPFRFSVEITGEFKTVTDIANTIVARIGRRPIRLREVGEVRESVAERRGLVRLDGVETLLLLVERRPVSNTVAAAAAVRETLAELDGELPGVHLAVVVDESNFIEDAIGGVTQAVWLGGLLALVMLFVFLRRPRALLAVGLAVPLSLGMTLALFEVLDVTFNLISLSGLALGVGMLVDNAIVVVENIARLREMGQPPRQAAQTGALEVAGAITASTLTTIAVFLPLTFVEGLAGRLFRDQSLAVVCSLLASLVVALTVVPLVASKDSSTGLRDQVGGLLHRFLGVYDGLLIWSLRHRVLVLGLAILGMVSLGWLGNRLPREVIPETDQGRLEMHLTLPPAADLPLVSARAETLEREIRQAGWVAHLLADVGERDQARLDVDPRPPYEADLVLILPPDQPMVAVQAALAEHPFPPDIQVEVRSVQTQLEQLLTSDKADLFIDLITERRIDVDPVVAPLLERLQASTALANVKQADEALIPAYQLQFNQENIMRLGVSTQTLRGYLEAAARGRHATDLRTVNEEIPIMLRSHRFRDMEDLLRTQIPTTQGLFPLDLFVTATRVEIPSALIRTDQASVVRLVADVAEGAGLVEAERAIAEACADILPRTVRHQVRGANEAFASSLGAIGWSLLLSLLLVYLILTAQFERLLQPFVILMAVPLAIAGVVLALLITDQTLNLMSLTGCVVLVGIVVNDAIVKVDFINQRRAEGMVLNEAILRAGRDRVRPILMTTFTTVLGLLPLAFGLGQGAELRAPLAIAIVGGLLSATFLTLIVVPVLYAVFAGKK